MKLFTEKLKDRTEKSGFSMSRFEFLDSSNWTVVNEARERLESWFRNFPKDPEFLGNFRSKKDIHHEGALTELFINQLMIDLSLKTCYHHSIGTRKVDFRITDPRSEEQFIIECTMSGQPNHVTPIESIENQILDKIESLDLKKFIVRVNFITSNKATPALRLLSRQIIDATKANRPESLLFKDAGWQIEIDLMERPTSFKSNLAMNASSQGGGFISGPSADILKRTFDKKRGSSYGKLDVPFVIAVNSQNMFLDDSIVFESLFGNKSIVQSGFFKPSQNRSVSAIMMMSKLYWNNLDGTKISIWHNPWAKLPLDKNLLSFDQYDLTLGSQTGRFKLDKTEGTVELANILS